MPQVMKDDAAVKRGPESVSRLPGFLTPSGQRDLKKFGLNERSMEDWLRLQAEKIAAQKVKFKQGMSWSSSRPLYFATRRDTHSDIMCVTTTTRPSNITRCDDGSLPGDGFGLSVKEILAKGVTYGKMPIGLETSDVYPTLKKSMYTNPLRRPEDIELEEKDRKNRALWKEQAAFMLHLNERRREQLKAETEAASMIQRQYRGFALRKWLKKERHRLRVRRRMQRSYRVVSRQVKMKLEMEQNLKKAEERKRFAAQKIQKTYWGWMARRIANRERYQRVEEINMWAATTIQCAVRKRLCLRAFAKLKMYKKEHLEDRAVLMCQKVVRMHIAKQRVASRRLVLEDTAAIWIQRWYRRRLTDKVPNKERDRKKFEKRNHAAIDMQRIFRGKLGRRVVWKLHEFEKLEFKHAAGLTIQRVWRGHNGRVIMHHERLRMKVEREVLAALTIQRVLWRGEMGRRVYRAYADTIRQDIYVQCRLGRWENVKSLFEGFDTDIIYTPTSTDDNGNTVFLVACRWGHKKIVKKTLRWPGTDINHMNDFQQSGVELAIIQGSKGGPQVAEYLLSKKCEINMFGRNLLHECCARDYPNVANLILARGVNPNEVDDEQRTAMHEAAIGHSPKCVQLLIDAGAEKNLQDKDGNTPLHLAAIHNAPKVIEVLIEYGADGLAQNAEGRTPWRQALTSNNDDCAQLLRRAYKSSVAEATNDKLASNMSDADKEKIFKTARKGDITGTEAYVDGGISPDFTGEGGETLLMAAASSGNRKLCELLMRKNAQLHKKDDRGRNALHYSAPHKEVSDYFASKGGDILAPDDQGITPIHLAATHNHAYRAAVKMLRCDCDVQDEKGLTPMHYAARAGAPNAVEALISFRCDLVAKDRDENTPLHLAAPLENGRDVVKLLVAAGAGVDQVNAKGESVVHAAAYAANKDTLGYLLDGGAEGTINLPDAKGQTALHVVAEKGSVPCINLLCQFGAAVDPVAQGNSGLTPLGCALMKGHGDAAVALLKKGARVTDKYDGGVTPLHAAALNGGISNANAVVEALMRAGAKTNLPDDLGRSPLVVAVQNGAVELSAALIAAGADPLLDVYVGNQALERTLMHAAAGAIFKGNGAARKSAGPLIDFTLGLGFDIKEKGSDGANALLVAAAAGNVPGMEHLLKNHGETFSVRDVDNRGRGVAHYAAEEGRVEALRFLVRAGADPELADQAGESPVHLAAQNDHHEVLELFAELLS